MSVWELILSFIRRHRNSFSTWIVLSFLIHALVFTTVDSTKKRLDKKPLKEPVKIKIIPETSKEELAKKKIIETKLKETKKPKDSKFFGHTDHQAKKEQKLKKELLHTKKALDPSESKKVSTPVQERKLRVARPPQQASKKLSSEKIERKKKLADKGRKKATPEKKKEPLYKNLLSDSMKILSQMRPQKEEFRDHVQEDLVEGDSIDLSTTKFRYIGYFTNLRKQIEMTWVYPTLAARNGKQGSVFLEFTIAKNGKASKIKVLRSSGYRILDESIVQAIREASPFAPLPQSIGKERLRITGTFYYIISGYSSSY